MALTRPYAQTLILVAALGVGAAAACRAPEPASGQAATAPAARAALPYDVVRAEDLLAHITFLADDLLEGRAPTTRGGELAARYIATQFALAGLTPAGDDGSWFQHVPIVESVVSPDFTLEARGTEGAAEPVRLAYGRDVVANSGLDDDTVAVDAELVFVGHGIVAPEYDWDDYAGLDVAGRVVLVMVNDPPATANEPELFGGEALTYYGRWTYKYEEAARQGAAGAILIHTDESATYPWQVVESSWTGAQYAIEPPPGTPRLAIQAWVTDEAARSLAALGGQDLDALRAAALDRGAPPVPLDVRVAGTISQTVTRDRSPNVIGRLPGANADEAIVYTAHYDHLGVREQPDGEVLVYNGAVDNASGIAGLLQVAQLMGRAEQPPGRSVYFVATTAEESGLLGSEHFSAHPPIAIDRLAANINMDAMNVYGPARDLVLLGRERSTLDEVAVEAAEAWDRVLGDEAHPERGYFFRSDHFPLAKAGVPALSYNPGTEFASIDARRLAEAYNETDYHQPTDTVKPEWNLEGLVDDVRFLADLGWRIAALPEMPAYHADDQFARPRQGTE